MRRVDQPSLTMRREVHQYGSPKGANRTSGYWSARNLHWLLETGRQAERGLARAGDAATASRGAEFVLEQPHPSSTAVSAHNPAGDRQLHGSNVVKPSGPGDGSTWRVPACLKSNATLVLLCSGARELGHGEVLHPDNISFICCGLRASAAAGVASERCELCPAGQRVRSAERAPLAGYRKASGTHPHRSIYTCGPCIRAGRIGRRSGRTKRTAPLPAPRPPVAICYPEISL